MTIYKTLQEFKDNHRVDFSESGISKLRYYVNTRQRYEKELKTANILTYVEDKEITENLTLGYALEKLFCEDFVEDVEQNIKSIADIFFQFFNTDDGTADKKHLEILNGMLAENDVSTGQFKKFLYLIQLRNKLRFSFGFQILKPLEDIIDFIDVIIKQENEKLDLQGSLMDATSSVSYPPAGLPELVTIKINTEFSAEAKKLGREAFSGDIEVVSLLIYLDENFSNSSPRFTELTKYNQIYFFLNSLRRSPQRAIPTRPYKELVQELFKFKYGKSEIKGESEGHHITLSTLYSHYKEFRVELK